MESLAVKRKLSQCPRENANLISYLAFIWTIPLFLKGRKQTINDEDLFQPLHEQKAENLAKDICESWNAEVEKQRKKDRQPWLVDSLLEVFKWEIIGQGLFLLFIECGIKILPPLFLNEIIKYHEYNGNVSRTIMYLSTFGITLCIFFNVITMHAFNLSNLNLGLKMRVAVSTLIYNKCLKLSKNTLGNVSFGRIVNLLSSDVAR
jgi:ABC transporter transmembrane region